MRNVLIVSPCFPPVSSADMQRVRMSLPHFASFGWKPIVLAVAAEYVESVQDALLLDTIPADVEVQRVRAIPTRWTRRVKLGDLGMRSIAFLHSAGSRLLEERAIDLVYFSTTMFTTLPLGRLWKQQYRVPYVIDMQDLWVSDYWETHQEVKRVTKAMAAERVHRCLESWTMPEADGLIAVSQDYITTLVKRYPRLQQAACLTLPFGASEADFDAVRRKPQANRFFEKGDGLIHGVYVGRGGADMAPALRMIFGALRCGLMKQPELFSRLRLHFVGTSYAPEGLREKTIEPVAAEFGLERQVTEEPGRVPYFEAMQLLLDADFLVAPGSDDPQYTASKIFPYILSRKPILAVFHERSSVCGILRRTGAGVVCTLGAGGSEDVLGVWSEMLRKLPYAPATKWEEFREYSAEEMVRQQCGVFDRVRDFHRGDAEARS